MKMNIEHLTLNIQHPTLAFDRLPEIGCSALDVGCWISLKFVKRQRPTLLLAEVRESFAMALNALAAHKLRSALTLLGVLIGVFSIIVVMTAMRVLERNVETNLSQLGSQTFAIQKWPEVQFGDRSDWEKYWRRKDITLEQGQTVEEKATLAAAVGIEGQFLGRQISDPLRQNRAHRAAVRRNARQFPGAQLDH